MRGTRDGCKLREDAEDRFEGPEDERTDSKWHTNDDYGVGTNNSNRAFGKGNERVSRRVVRERERTESIGDRSELLKESASDRSPRANKKSGWRRGDVTWDDSEEGRASGRGKRSREDGWRDRLMSKGGGGIPLWDSDDGSNRLVRKRGQDVRGYGPLVRSGAAAEERADFEDVLNPPGRPRTDSTEDDRFERISDRGKTALGREGSDDDVRLGGRCKGDQWEDRPVEKSPIGGSEKIGELAEAVKYSGRAAGEGEGEVGGKQRDKVGRERSVESKVVPNNFGKLGRRSRGNIENQEMQTRGDVGDGRRDESEDGDRWRGGRALKELSMYGTKDSYRDWTDPERGWMDSECFGEEKATGSRIGEKNRQRYNSGRGHETPDEYPWERERWRELEEGSGIGCPSDLTRDRYREGVDRELLQDLDRKRERDERERSSRERMDGYISDRVLLHRDRVEELPGPNAMGLVNEGFVGGAPNVPLQSTSDPCGKISYGALSAVSDSAVSDSEALPGEYRSEVGDADWEGPVQEERERVAYRGYIDNRERHATEDEPPPGLEQGLGSSLGRAGCDDGGMGFNLNGGRGRSKCSPSNWSRGPMIGHDGRPNLGNNLGPVLMNRGFQPGGKGSRGGRGPGKVGRIGGRDGQRGNLPVISQLGPGMPGPRFSQLGPQGPVAGLGPGIMGPGTFPLPPFGGRIGWNVGRDTGMMNGRSGPVAGPPRFVPGMGPGPPGPNRFFSSLGPVRGGPSALSLSLICGGNSPFGGRPLPGDRQSLAGRNIFRGGGPAGRGPSRGDQNDYSQHFVDTGLRPQNFIRDVELADRFEEYPKLKELIARKDKLISERATPPMYLQCDLRDLELRPEVFGTKFDVILVDPPWEEYVRRAPGVGDSMEWWSHADIQSLRIEAISDTPAFIFLWVGDAEGLDQGRLCLKKWGFRRCEDICWVKTNRENPTPALRHDSNTVLQHSKEHCLMGIKGTVRRSTDGHIIHANVDTDIIISEEPDYGCTAKPEELYHIIEHFAQGQRRLELFGEDHNIRAGWVTVGKGLSSSNFSPQAYAKHFFDCEGKLWQGGRGNPPFDAPHLVGTTSEIESLRPKSPPPRAQQQPQSHIANAALPPATNNGNNSRRPPFTASQGGSTNAPSILSSGPVAHTTESPVETGHVSSGGRAVSNTRISKPTETVTQWDTMKSSGSHECPGPAKVTNEERSFAIELDVLSELQSVSKSHLLKPAVV